MAESPLTTDQRVAKAFGEFLSVELAVPHATRGALLRRIKRCIYVVQVLSEGQEIVAHANDCAPKVGEGIDAFAPSADFVVNEPVKLQTHRLAPRLVGLPLRDGGLPLRDARLA